MLREWMRIWFVITLRRDAYQTPSTTQITVTAAIILLYIASPYKQNKNNIKKLPILLLHEYPIFQNEHTMREKKWTKIEIELINRGNSHDKYKKHFLRIDKLKSD